MLNLVNHGELKVVDADWKRLAAAAANAKATRGCDLQASTTIQPAKTESAIASKYAAKVLLMKIPRKKPRYLC